MKKRKLLSSKALTMIESHVAIGVPLAAVIRNMELDMSRPSVAKLLARLKEAEDSHVITMSLFPPWLDPDSLKEQEQPDNWYYEGYFPRGVWCERVY